jgi:tRNA (guanosine-2'-O-)-methyltransferase
MRAVLERRQDDLQIVLEGIDFRHNTSAMLRTADSFAVGRVHLLHPIDRWHWKVERVSRGAYRWVDVRSHASISECVTALHADGLRVVVTEPEASHTYLEFDWSKPTALWFGSEGIGCSQEARALADERISIPQLGMSTSLNVSVAAGIVLSEVYRQRVLAEMYEPAWNAAKQRTLEAWVQRQVDGTFRSLARTTTS